MSYFAFMKQITVHFICRLNNIDFLNFIFRLYDTNNCIPKKKKKVIKQSSSAYKRNCNVAITSNFFFALIL